MARRIGVALVVVLGCRGSDRTATATREESRVTPVVLEVDRPDPSGDRALVWPAPLDSSSAALPDEPTLRAFSCTKEITGKRPNGQLQISFWPTTPSDVELRIEFRSVQPGCNYTGTVRVSGGRLDDGALGLAYVYRCRRSPHTAFAVSCGPYLGSDVNVLVRGNGWGRTVSFRVPPSIHTVMPDAAACSLPFASYDDAQHPTGLDSDELVFDLADCRYLL